MRKPLRGEHYCYIANSWFEISMTEWCDDLTDEARWRVGNVFFTLEQVQQAREEIKKALNNFHQLDRIGYMVDLSEK